MRRLVPQEESGRYRAVAAPDNDRYRPILLKKSVFPNCLIIDR